MRGLFLINSDLLHLMISILRLISKYILKMIVLKKLELLNNKINSKVII